MPLCNFFSGNEIFSLLPPPSYLKIVLPLLAACHAKKMEYFKVSVDITWGAGCRIALAEVHNSEHVKQTFV